MKLVRSRQQQDASDEDASFSSVPTTQTKLKSAITAYSGSAQMKSVYEALDNE